MNQTEFKLHSQSKLKFTFLSKRFIYDFNKKTDYLSNTLIIFVIQSIRIKI